MNETTIIYALHDKDGAVHYVGRTTNLQHRSISHMKSRPWFHHHSVLEIVRPQDAAEREYGWISYYRRNGSELENKNHFYYGVAVDPITAYRHIKRVAKDKHITFGKIAEACGTTSQAISIVAASRSASRRLRRAICYELGIHPVELGWMNIADEYDARLASITNNGTNNGFTFLISPKA